MRFESGRYSLPKRVWLDGKDVSDRALAMDAAPEPDVEVWGSIETLMLDANGRALSTHGELMPYTLYGKIRWEYAN